MSRVEARRQRKRGDYLSAAAAVFAALVLGVVVTAFVVLSGELDSANQARDALARQVQGLGEKPVGGPPGSRGEPGPATVGPRGPTGPSGKDGASGEPAPTITPRPGPSGPPGRDGAVGADSTVPGPTGPAGSPGQDATGVPGADGQDGADGADGSDGDDGSPPREWTYTDQDGNTYQCTPGDDFDPDTPRYRCTATSTPSPEPSDAPSQSPSGDAEESGLVGGLLPLPQPDRRRD